MEFLIFLSWLGTRVCKGEKTFQEVKHDLLFLVSNLLNPIRLFHLFLAEVGSLSSYMGTIKPSLTLGMCICFIMGIESYSILMLLYGENISRNYIDLKMLFCFADSYTMIIKCFLITSFQKIQELVRLNIF